MESRQVRRADERQANKRAKYSEATRLAQKRSRSSTLLIHKNRKHRDDRQDYFATAQ